MTITRRHRADKAVILSELYTWVAKIKRVTDVDENGCTVAHLGAQFGQLKMVQMANDKGLPVDMPDMHGQTSLYFAAQGGFDSIVLYLIEQGSTARMVQPPKGRTKLYNELEILTKAYHACQFATFRKIVETGGYTDKDISDVVATGAKYKTDDPNMLENILREYKVDLTVKSSQDKQTALYRAVHSAHHANYVLLANQDPQMGDTDYVDGLIRQLPASAGQCEPKMLEGTNAILLDMVTIRNAKYDMTYTKACMVSLLDVDGGDAQLATTIFRFATRPDKPEFESLPRWICKHGVGSASGATLRMLTRLNEASLLDMQQTGSDGLDLLAFATKIKVNQTALQFLERASKAREAGLPPHEFMVPAIECKIKALPSLKPPEPV
jgi:uncharacterized OsmC-like protein